MDSASSDHGSTEREVGVQAKTRTTPQPSTDFALLVAAVLLFLAWGDGTLWANAIGPWWSLVWLGPIAYSTRRLWKSEVPGKGWRIATPPIAFLLLGDLADTLAHSAPPWWLPHIAMAAIFFLVIPPEGYAPSTWYRPRQLGVGLAGLLLPWIPVGEPQHFWKLCGRLRAEASVDEALDHFSGYWVQKPNTRDGCARQPVNELAREEWRMLPKITFYPFDGDECTADLCWVWFEGGRMVRYHASPD